MNWQTLCKISDILPNSGVCALAGNHQVAVFRVSQAGNEQVYAIANYDPFSQANVLSRGLVGSKGDIPYVASPIYKQAFSLRDGRCLDDENVCLKTFPVQVDNDFVKIAV